MDITVLREKETWQAFGIGVVLFGIIAYSSLAVFGLSSSLYGVSDEIERVPDFEVISMNRTGIDDSIADRDGFVKMSSLRGSVVVLDFMAIDCSNCHYVQSHIEDRIEDWRTLEGEYPVIVISIASWYDYESFESINQTFGDTSSERSMLWPVVNGASDAVILPDGARGDIVEFYSAQSLPLALVIDHEGFVVAKEGTGTPLDGWSTFDGAVHSANSGDAEDLRFGIKKAERSFSGVFLVGLFLGVLVYFSPCAFPVLPSYISYYLSLSVREEEMMQSGLISNRVPGSFEVGSIAAMGQLTFFAVVGVIIFGLDGLISLSGFLHDIAILISLILFLLGGLMLLGWTSHLLAWIQKILDMYVTTESDEKFTPRRNMFLWGIGYSAASVDCTAAAVFPFVAWLAVVGEGAFVMGMAGLMISVSLLMICVTVLVGLGRDAMIDRLRRSTAIVKATGAWMMMFAGMGLFAYLTQPDLVTRVLG